MKIDDAKIEYFERGFFPMYLGFTMSEKDFQAEMVRLSVTEPQRFIKNDHSHATIHSFENDSMGLICIITLCPRGSRKRSMSEIVGLLAHEAMHVIQLLKDYVGEQNMGRETEAYYLQHLIQNLLCSYREKRKQIKNA